MDTALKAGDPAPHLELLNQDLQLRSLADLRGRLVIVYFFPKAFSPECTTEVCDFRDNHQALASDGYTVIGVSADTPATLREFADTHLVGHDLLSDPDHHTTRRWGAWGPKVVNGAATVGALRSTFLVAADGRLRSVQYDVAANGHVAQVRAALSAQPSSA